MRRTPALIIGGGPAGAACAAVLAQAGRPHLLIERAAETGDALCGGFLSWRSLQSLASLGIDVDRLNSRRVGRVRLFHRDRRAEARLPRPAIGVSRHRLDQVMLAHAEAAGSAIERGAGAAELSGQDVRLRDGGTITAGAIFLATGKHDLRGAARPADARGDDPTLGFRLRIAASPELHRLIDDAVELHLVDRGYAGLVLQEDGSANLCLAVHRSRLTEAGDATALLHAMARECPPLAERLSGWGGGPIDAVANIPYGWRARKGVSGLFRLGDQAGVIPSLAGEGMGIAIASGIRAAIAYCEGGADAAPRYQRAFAGALARPMALAGLIRRAAESPMLAGAVLSIAQTAPFLTHAAARWTRIADSRIDAPRASHES